MRPGQLRSLVPTLTGDPKTDVEQLNLALHDILRLIDDYRPLFAARGNILIGNRSVASDARRGFIYLPTIDGSGPPTGTPVDFGAGDPVVFTRTDRKLWAYNFSTKEWEEIPQSDDDNDILELLLMILQELQVHREMGI